MIGNWKVIAAAAGAFVGALLLARRLTSSSSSSSSSPPARPVDPYAPHEPATGCDPVAKPGPVLFRQWALAKWGQRPGSPENILRPCDDKADEHQEGRAWDLMTNSIEHGDEIIAALLTPDPETGEPDALMRRAGVMYAIWNRRMWRAYPWQGSPSGSWGPYSGASPHTDHIHFSFSKAGAAGETSLYDEIRAQFPQA